MTRLLAGIAQGRVLTPASCALIMEMMRRTQQGWKRLAGGLPSGVMVANKPGTIPRIVNDVGVIELPGEAGRLAISVFTLRDEHDLEASERVIAELARAAYDAIVGPAIVGPR